nr:hypothetical protein CFP56_21696 [Quercus suber]
MVIKLASVNGRCRASDFGSMGLIPPFSLLEMLQPEKLLRSCGMHYPVPPARHDGFRDNHIDLKFSVGHTCQACTSKCVDTFLANDQNAALLISLKLFVVPFNSPAHASPAPRSLLVFAPHLARAGVIRSLQCCRAGDLFSIGTLRVQSVALIGMFFRLLRIQCYYTMGNIEASGRKGALLSVGDGLKAIRIARRRVRYVDVARNLFCASSAAESRGPDMIEMDKENLLSANR